jgi:tetratricopeptide (TPR) repeat protein
MRQGIEYLEKQGVLKENMEKPVTIVSNMGYALEVYTKKYGDKVKWVYADYKQRYTTKVGGKPSNLRWDYGLFISLFVPSDQLRAGSWPMKSATIHTVEVAGTPVLAVMQQDTAQRIVKSREALAANNLALATTLLQEEVSAHPDNEIALSELAECQLNGGNFAAAKATADLMLKVSPQNKVAYYMKGLAQAQMQDLNGAISALQMALKCEPNFAPARELLSKLLAQRK